MAVCKVKLLHNICLLGRAMIFAVPLCGVTGP